MSLIDFGEARAYFGENKTKHKYPPDCFDPKNMDGRNNKDIMCNANDGVTRKGNYKPDTFKILL
jgi:hypothetical protein